MRQLSHIPFVSHPENCDLLLSLCHSAGLPAVPAQSHNTAARAVDLAELSLHFASPYSCCCMSSAQWLLHHAQAACLLLFASLQLKMMVDFEMTGMLDGKAALCLAALFPAVILYEAKRHP